MAREVLTYWAVAQLFGLVGLPLARVFFRPLPDQGYAFAKTLGLLLTGYLAWLIAMLGLAPFGAPLLVVCALVVLGAGLLLPRPGDHGPARASSPPASDASLGIRAGALPYQLRPITWPLAWLRESWRLVLGYELLFALALLFLALLRSYEFGTVGPNPWGTERPMDYALFNAIRQSESFPPHDPWLSGYPINYYYFGYLLMAAVALLSGLGPAVSYNLSLALVFALAALGAAGMVYNLIELTVGGRRPKAQGQIGDAEKPPGEPASRTGRAPGSAAGRWLAMALAVVLVLFAGNQGGALQLITGTDMAVALRGGDLARAVANGLGPRQTIALAEPFRGEYFDGTSEITPRDVAQDFNWWNSSRAVWDDFRVPNQETGATEIYRRYAITEFPFFSFWLGDMHPHVMALPFGLLALALALTTMARPDVPRFGQGREGWIGLLIAGVVLGSLYVINSWDLPTYVILFVAALAVRYWRSAANEQRPGAERKPTDEGDVEPAAPSSTAFPWRELGTQAGVVLLAAFTLFLPFHLTFRSLVGGKEPLIDVPLLATITRTIGFVTWGRTELHAFLIVFGLFLLPLLAYVATQLGRGGEGALPLPRWWPLAVLGALVLGLAFGLPLLFLLPLGILAASAAFERASEPATAFTLGAFALGCAICFGVELVYIRDVFESRLNTVFKFYYQTWLIWGVLAAYAAWWLAFGPGARGRERAGHFLVLGLFAVLLVGALVYPWHTAGRAFSEGRAAGLAGVTPRERNAEGAASIAWLRQNVPGDAVILEAVGPAYDTDGLGFGGVSSATGLATVMGWEGHQGQWRGGQPEVLAQIGPRAADVATIYSTPDAGVARELLAKYGVDYIYVGGAERVTYPPEGIAKLEQLGSPVFQQGEVTIYQVAP